MAIAGGAPSKGGGPGKEGLLALVERWPDALKPYLSLRG